MFRLWVTYASLSTGENNMHVKSAEYLTSAVQLRGYPEVQMPEIAFAGRSNVGKSSLIDSWSDADAQLLQH